MWAHIKYEGLLSFRAKVFFLVSFIHSNYVYRVFVDSDNDSSLVCWHCIDAGLNIRSDACTATQTQGTVVCKRCARALKCIKIFSAFRSWEWLPVQRSLHGTRNFRTIKWFARTHCAPSKRLWKESLEIITLAWMMANFQFHAHKTIFRSQHVPQTTVYALCAWCEFDVTYIKEYIQRDCLAHC